MQFAVALIEYLISGIAASAWLAALLHKFYAPYLPADPLAALKDTKELFILVYLPVVYVLGIYVDTTSSFLIRRSAQLDKQIHAWLEPVAPQRDRFLSIWEGLIGSPKKQPYEKTAQIVAHSIPDAVRMMETYVSRDRIARGAAFNAFAGCITALMCASAQHLPIIFLVCAIVFVYSCMMHNRLSRLSSQFKKVVRNNLRAASRTPIRQAGKRSKA